MTRPHLPDDIEALKDLVLENFQRAELYKFRYDNLVRQHFGRSSEKLGEPPGQQLLFELPTRPEPPAPEPAVESPAPSAA